MPFLVSPSTLRCLSGSGHNADNRHHSKGDPKGMLGASRCPTRTPGLYGGTNSNLCAWQQQHRQAALPSHQDAAGDGTAALGASAAATDSPSAAADADWEAVRLMTAAKILSSAASTDGDGDSSVSNDYSSSLSDSLTASAQLDDADLGPLALLDEIHTINADSLALAVGILRQQQPLDAHEEDVQLSERLRDFLMVLSKRPASTAAAPPAQRSSHAGAGSSTSTAGNTGALSSSQPLSAATAAEGGAFDDEDGFWASADEWADVRAALMNIGVNASLDEEDEEDVWDLEAGRVKTRRTRLLRRLPKLDSDTAQQLTAFLAELQQHLPDQHTAAGSITAGQQQPHADPVAHGNAASTTTAAGSGGEHSAGHVASDEEEQWWEQAALAFDLLRQQAGKVQQQTQEQQVVDASQ